MSKFLLNHENIDIASNEIIDFLTNESVASKDVQRIRLSVEEILLKYFNHFGSEKEFEVSISKRFRSLKIELTIAGESVNPFDSDGDYGEILNSLLTSLGLAPVWRYKNGKNKVTFTVKKKKKISQTLQLGIAILAAIVLGGLCTLLPDNISAIVTNDVVSPVFDTFMGLLSAIAGPIIFLSVVWGICGIGDMTTFGKIGKRMIGRFVFVSFIVGALCVAFCTAFFSVSSGGEASFAFKDLYLMVLDIIPSNLVVPFVEGNSLQIIFIAVIVGLTMLFLGDRVPIVTSFINQLNVIMQTIMGAVSSFLPVFVFGSIFKMIVGNNIASVLKSYKLILVLLAADLMLMGVYIVLISSKKKVSPMNLLKKTMPTFVIGLTTASSVAAYQTNTQCCEKQLGVDKKIIDVGVPLGQVIFMPGAIILFVCTAFGMAETYGVVITPVWMITAFIISVVLGIAAPPVPGATLTCYTILFMQLGIPSEAIAVAIALNVVLEFVTTAVDLFCLQTELVELSGTLELLDVKCLKEK